NWGAGGRPGPASTCHRPAAGTKAVTGAASLAADHDDGWRAQIDLAEGRRPRGVRAQTSPPASAAASPGDDQDRNDLVDHLEPPSGGARRSNGSCTSLGSVAVAVDDPPAVQVVRRQLDANPVSGRDPDPVAPHPARGIRQE